MSSCDQARDLGEGAVLLSAICEACFQNRYFVVFALPFPDQASPGFELDLAVYIHRSQPDKALHQRHELFSGF